VLPAKTKLILLPVNQSKCGKAATNKKLVKRSKHESTSDSSSDDQEPPRVSSDDSDSDNELFLVCSMRVTCATHIIIFDLIILNNVYFTVHCDVSVYVTTSVV
jgi:hypothetical protein